MGASLTLRSHGVCVTFIRSHGAPADFNDFRLESGMPPVQSLHIWTPHDHNLKSGCSSKGLLRYKQAPGTLGVSPYMSVGGGLHVLST